MITGVYKEVDGLSYNVSLDNENELFFTVPINNDGSDDWSRLQEWFDAGNGITEDLSKNCLHYIAQRKQEYPSMEEQLDYIYHNGVEAWKSDIVEPIKTKYPKPT